ncbi:MAG: S41 family peptidase [Candidatus Kapaibacterium sp.]|jgi:carboxyl-terminal processing protease|nr:S41 family peptidase [Candidatus Kapabacteria bacterium]
MKKKIGIFLIVLVFAAILTGFTKDYYFKINKAFDIFGAVFRELTSNYVLEIDPEILVKGAIKGMISTLDPYTEFYDMENKEDFDILTSGTYTGFGISISNIDSILTITHVRDGYSARENGLRIGDRIFSVDNDTLYYREYDSIRDILKGEAGTKSEFRILRDGLADTLKFKLTREQILLDNISFYDVLDNNIAYIKLERFNKTAAQDFRFALNDLKSKSKLSSLIIDLRNNPGGLLEPAVQICEMFLPTGSLIVSTRGRNDEELYTYTSSSNPIEPDLPLIVLINENSASASEIIAGALQDYDRAVIIGKRSFGKGLVQSIMSLPYKGNLKITTAKYYIPSGRCIQRIKFGLQHQSESKVSDSPDSTVFFTKNGRKVFESTGINPDTSTSHEYLSAVVEDLHSSLMFFRFANYFTSKMISLPENFKIDDKIFNEFLKFLDEKDYAYESESEKILKRIDEISEQSKYSKSFEKSLISFKKSLKDEEKDLLTSNKKEISDLLEFEIKSRFLSEKELFKNLMAIDNDLVISKHVLLNNLYDEILSSE